MGLALMRYVKAQLQTVVDMGGGGEGSKYEED